MMQQTDTFPTSKGLVPSQLIKQVPKMNNHTLNDRISQDYQNILSHRQEMKSKSLRRRQRNQNTPSEILKNNILKNRQSKKIMNLKSITQQNLKLFQRLQSQRSPYEFTSLHRQLSCSILPIAKSHSSQRNQVDQKLSGQVSRCSSTLSIRRSNDIPQTNIQREENVLLQQAHNRLPTATSKLTIIHQKNNKENMVGNLSRRNREIEEKQQGFLMKKMGFKLPLSSIKIGGKKKSGCQEILDVDLPLSFRPPKKTTQNQRGFLTQRKNDVNI